jgi:hypothetical protein
VRAEEQQRFAIALNLPSSPAMPKAGEAIALQREGIVDIAPTIENVRYALPNAPYKIKRSHCARAQSHFSLQKGDRP